MKEPPEQFMEAFRFANKSAPLHIGDNMPDPNTCGGHYAALTGSPYAGPGPRGLETCPDTETYIQDLHQQLRESRARVAELEGQVREIPDLLLIAHMQGAEQAKDQIQALRAQIESLDCRLVGRVAELSGSHCPADRPCDRCVAERMIANLISERDQSISHKPLELTK